MAREYVRLHFRDGGKLDLPFRVQEWQAADFEAGWRKVGVRVEWLRSPRGRLDAALDWGERYVTQIEREGRKSP